MSHTNQNDMTHFEYQKYGGAVRIDVTADVHVKVNLVKGFDVTV
jgi:hypothetical protein